MSSRWALVFLLAFVLVAVVLASMLPGGTGADPRSATDYDPRGQAAMFLLADRLGWRARLWDEPPVQLPAGRHVLFTARPPRSALGEEASELRAPNAEASSHSLEHYAAFVRQGGVLVSFAGRDSDGLADFYRDAFGLEGEWRVERVEPSGRTVTPGTPEDHEDAGPAEDHEDHEDAGPAEDHEGHEDAGDDEDHEHAEDAGPGGAEEASDQEDGLDTDEPFGHLPSRPRVRFGGETLELRFGLRRLGGDLAPFEPAIVDEGGRPLAARASIGAGELWIFAAGSFLENRSLEEDQNALFYVRLLEALAPDPATDHVLFDEYALGAWAPESALGLAFGPRLFWLSVHLLLLAGLLGWSALGPGDYPRDAPPTERLTALSRAQAWANLLARSRRWSFLGLLLQRGVARRLLVKLRLGGRQEERELPPEERLVEALEKRGDDREDLRALARLLSSKRELESESALEELGASLAEVEARLLAGLEAPKARDPRRQRA